MTSVQEVSGPGEIGVAIEEAVPSVEEEVMQKGKGRLIKQESFEVILDWLDEVNGCEIEAIKEEDMEDLDVEDVDELESMDETESDASVARRQSQEI